MTATRERFFLELEPPIEELRGKPHVVIVGGVEGPGLVMTPLTAELA